MLEKVFSHTTVMEREAERVIDAISTAAPGARVPLYKYAPKPLLCPCCKQVVALPTLDIVKTNYGITPQEFAILETCWRGRGEPVPTERIFDAMYADDPDGGPPLDKMYANFKVAICHLRKKLEGSGINVLSVGYRRGYRVSLETKFPTAKEI